jgi:hypothetical protein
LVAAITRRFAAMVSSPTRWKVLSCRTWSSLIWAAGVIVPISSRKIVVHPVNEYPCDLFPI